MSVYYNDNNHFCAQVLRMNIQRGLLPEGTVDERSITEIHASDFVGYNHIHLFAGIGGFPLGLQWADFPQSIRVLTGGFPCQDISKAGKGAGLKGEKSGLWSEMYRLILEAIDCDCRFDYILIENVSALTGRGLADILTDLAKAGYDAEWFCLRASDTGAPHARERIFLVVYTSGTGWWQCDAAPIANSQGYIAGGSVEDRIQGQFKPLMGRVLDGISRWVDMHRWPARPDEKQYAWEQPRVIADKIARSGARLEALGNAIVPQLVAEIGRAIMSTKQVG